MELPSADALKTTNLCDAGAREGHDDSHHVDSELELEELGNAVVDVASPHHSFDDTRKVVVGQDDVRCLFGYICAGDPLKAEVTVHLNLTATLELTHVYLTDHSKANVCFL